MTKIIYCFWTDHLITNWKESRSLQSKEEFLGGAVDMLYLSVCHMESHDFKVEIVTDCDGAALLAKLPIKNVAIDLESIKGSGKSWIEMKMFAMSLQSEPFIYCDWNISLKDESLVERIKNSDKDCLVGSTYKIVLDTMVNSRSEVVFNGLRSFTWLMDMSGHYIDEFARRHDTCCDCRIVGFNNMEMRDFYVENFNKCLDMAKLAKWFMDSSCVIEEYLLYCLSTESKYSIDVLRENLSETRGRNLDLFNGKELRSFLGLSRKQRQIINDDISRYSKKKTIVESNLRAKESADRPRLSLCTVVMNRKDHLLETLRHNAKIIKRFGDQVDLNVINYNSTDGLEEYLFGLSWFKEAVANSKINYYANYDAEKYHRTLPKNIIHFLSKGEFLCNLDADNFISESYLTKVLKIIETNDNMYFRPSLFSDSGAFGRIGIHRSDFQKLGGYNLKIVNWGYEDVEITMRLRKLGVQQILIDSHLCLDVISHSDELRLENEEYFTRGTSDQKMITSEQENRQLSFELFPNIDFNYNLKLFKFSETFEKIRIDDTNSYISY